MLLSISARDLINNLAGDVGQFLHNDGRQQNIPNQDNLPDNLIKLSIVVLFKKFEDNAVSLPGNDDWIINNEEQWGAKYCKKSAAAKFLL
eukprot:6596100-Ditylum_brightwellii.AAC.1